MSIIKIISIIIPHNTIFRCLNLSNAIICIIHIFMMILIHAIVLIIHLVYIITNKIILVI